MSRAGWWATAPLRALNAAVVPRRRRRRLPHPTISVGNLALGGRGKTPTVAAIVRELQRRGRRPAVLTRGYGGRSSRRPTVLLGVGAGEPWAAPVAVDGDVRPAWQHAGWGDEAAWLAAVLPGVPVGVHPDRAATARGLAGRVDAFVLDDGFQSAVGRDVDVVLVDPRDRGRAATREGESALRRAAVVAELGRDLVKAPGALRRLDGATGTPPPLILAAGVGDPSSVEATAAAMGLSVRGRRRLRDHGAWRGPPPSGPLLVTEKDAVGWAARRAFPDTWVLGLTLQGADAVAVAAADALGVGCATSAP